MTRNMTLLWTSGHYHLPHTQRRSRISSRLFLKQLKKWYIIQFWLADFRIMVNIMVFNATFNNTSIISWQSVVLVEETGLSPEKTTNPYSCIKYTPPWPVFEITSSVVIGTDCLCSYKSNYHTITTLWYTYTLYNIYIGYIGQIVVTIRLHGFIWTRRR